MFRYMGKVEEKLPLCLVINWLVQDARSIPRVKLLERVEDRSCSRTPRCNLHNVSWCWDPRRIDVREELAGESMSCLAML